MRLLLTVAAALCAGPARAADPPAALKGVPADAAAVVYVEVAKLWASPFGASARAAGADDSLAEAKKIFGFGPADIAAVALVLPDLRADDGFEHFAVRVVSTKPYDRVKLTKVLRGTLDEKAGRIVLPDGREAVVDVSDPVAVAVLVNVPADTLRAAPAAGPLAGAFTAAGSHQLVVTLNRAKLPPVGADARSLDDAKPFLPLAEVDALTLTGKLAADGSMPLELLAATADPAKAKAAGKALGTALKFVRTVAAMTAAESGQEVRKNFQMRDPLGGLAPFVAALEPAIKAAAVKETPAGPAVALTLPSDLPVGSLARELFTGPPKFTIPRPGQSELVNNFKQVALALHSYHDVYNGLPPAAITDKQGKPLLSWRIAILPYIEQTPLYQQFKQDEPWDSAHNKKVLADNPMPKVFAVPGVTKPGEKQTHVQVFVGNGALFDPVKPVKIQDIPDGSSNTLLVALAKTPVDWTKPDDIPFDPKADMRKLLLSPGGRITVAFADGSVQFGNFSWGGDANAIRGLITKGGGEVVDKDVAGGASPTPVEKK